MTVGATNYSLSKYQIWARKVGGEGENSKGEERRRELKEGLKKHKNGWKGRKSNEHISLCTVTLRPDVRLPAPAIPPLDPVTHPHDPFTKYTALS